jgi:hypothetical protein
MRKFILLTILALVTIGAHIAQASIVYRPSVYNRVVLNKNVSGQFYFNQSNRFMTDGLISHWNFSGSNIDITTNSAFDRIGFATGTMISLATSTMLAPGRIGQGMQFNGTLGRIQVADSTALRPANFTLSGWFNCPNFSAATTVISKPRTAAPWSSPFTSWLIRINNSTVIEFGLANAGYSGTSATGLSLVTNTWYHVVMTYNGTTRVGYLNGAQILSNSLTGPISYAAQPVIIGADHGASPVGDVSPCRIDEVRIYNRALSSSEVFGLYSQAR